MPVYLDADDNIIKHKARYLDTLIHTRGIIYWSRKRRRYMYRPDHVPEGTLDGEAAVPFEWVASGVVKAPYFHRELK